jgi:uncharacterized protein (TIGR02594 family)
MGTPNIQKIQQALKAQGVDPGPADGVWGRRSIAAVKEFQRKAGLEVDGVVGPQTLKALFGDQTPPPAAIGGGAQNSGPLVWFEEALSLVGTKEKVGAGSNQVIIKWARNCNIDYADDDIPWCGLFVSHCIASTLPDEPLPPGPLGARNWLKFGEPGEPVQGAVLVFWRGSRNASTGHVGFYQSEDRESYHVLGGNQSDSVSTCRIKKDRLLGARWPTTAASVSGSKVTGEAEGGFSHNEQ